MLPFFLVPSGFGFRVVPFHSPLQLLSNRMLLFFLVPLCLAFRVAFSISVAARIQQNAAVFSDALRFRVFGFRVLEFRV